MDAVGAAAESRESKGIKFHMNAAVEKIQPDGGPIPAHVPVARLNLIAAHGHHRAQSQVCGLRHTKVRRPSHAPC